MKTLWIGVALSFLVSNAALAVCPTPPFFCGYTQNRSCYTRSGNVTDVTACPAEAAWSFGSGNSYVMASFTIGPNDCILNPDHFYIETWMEFTSPGGTPQDNFEVNIDVQHPDTTVSRYTLLYWSGAYGAISPCGPHQSRYFRADHGDTVTVYVRATNSGNATIVVTVPRLGSNS